MFLFYFLFTVQSFLISVWLIFNLKICNGAKFNKYNTL